MADLFQHGEQVGVRMGEDYEIDFGCLLVIVVFKEVSGEMHVMPAEHFLVWLDVGDDAVDGEAYDL